MGDNGDLKSGLWLDGGEAVDPFKLSLAKTTVSWEALVLIGKEIPHTG